MVDKENREEFIRLSPSSKSRMKTLPNRIAFKIFTPSTDRIGNTSRNVQAMKHDQSSGCNSVKAGKSGHGVLKAKRRTLATLQPSANSRGIVVGITRSEDDVTSLKKQGNGKSLKKEDIYHDDTEMAPSNELKESTPVQTQTSSQESKHFADDEQSTDSEQCSDDHDSLVQDALKLVNYSPSSDEYWKGLAEERRLALEEALTENEQLYDEVDSLKQNVADLEQALSEAEYFKLLYDKLMEDKLAAEGASTS